MSDADTILALSTAVVDKLTARGLTVATAESCTGGWIAKALTDVAGSSACFGYGIVSYSNAAKESVLGVDSETLSENGAVSEATVRAMASGALRISGAAIAVAVSGIAGPEGGSADTPVGTVWFAWATRGDASRAETECRHLDGVVVVAGREAVELQHAGSPWWRTVALREALAHGWSAISFRMAPALASG